VPPERSESAVVLVVLDGVRWQDVFAGADPALAGACGFAAGSWTNPRALMPHLHRLMEREGLAVGAPRPRGGAPDIAASGPHYISLPGYKEIFAGHPDPACDSNDCPAPTGPTLIDDVVASSGPGEVALVASWPAIARAATSAEPSFLLSAGRGPVANGAALEADAYASSLIEHAADDGPAPGEGDYRPDVVTAALALRVLRDVRPRFLFVGLGDADEHAHRGSYRGYLEALHASDTFLGAVVDTLHGMGARGEHTTLIVTTDHGRGYDFKDHGIEFPESARVWLVAAGKDVRGRGLLAARRPYTLSNVAPTVRVLLGMEAGENEPIREVTN
jgi:hypothetical protein